MDKTQSNDFIPHHAKDANPVRKTLSMHFMLIEDY